MNFNSVSSCLSLVIFTTCSLFVAQKTDAMSEIKTWKSLSELSSNELETIDLREQTPRDNKINYIPAEKYPFSPPYTAEEMGYRYAEFPHINRFSNIMNDVFGAVSPSGYINQGAWITLTALLEKEGLKGYIDHKPGKPYAKWLIWQTFPPDGQGGQQLWVPYRSDKNFRTKLDFYVYSKNLRRIRRMPEPRRDQRFPDNAQTMDDVMGRDPWEFKWEIIGSDILTETIRFPGTRPTITLNPKGEGFIDYKTKDLKIMGESFPYYKENHGVDCWVVKATADSDWVPNGYQEKYLIIWLEKSTFFPLRTEKYGLDNRLIMIEERITKKENPKMGDLGYTALMSVYWNLDHDLISYSLHDGLQLINWTEEEKENIFSTEFMRREWLYKVVKTQAMVKEPDQFFLRSHLYPNKFSEYRNVTLKEEVKKRYNLQEAAGKLVFETKNEKQE